MDAGEVVVFAGPLTDFIDVVVKSINEAGIAARVAAIDTVDPAYRPTWACTPDSAVYVIVANDAESAARDAIHRVWRVCGNCDATLLAEARNCQKCGTPDERLPGPHPDWQD